MNTYIFKVTVLFSLVISSTGYSLAFLDCELALKNLQKSPAPVRSLASIESLKIISYNLENFKVAAHDRAPQQVNRRPIKDKAPDLIKLQKNLIESWDPDILTAEEIFDEKSLNALISDRYVPVLIEGNDDERHIGFIIKKDLPFYVSVETHENEMWQNRKLFSRDLPVLLLRTSPSSDPVHIVIGNHGKSPRGQGSEELRAAQYKRAAQIVEQYKRKYPHAGILLAGDFNADTRSASDVAPIKASLNDPFELKQIPLEDRITHIYFPPRGPPETRQMDNIFVSPNLNDQILSIRVIPYLDENGQPKPVPKTFDERESNGSDHEAVEIVISTKNSF